MEQPTAGKSLNLLPWLRDAGDEVLKFFIEEANVLRYPVGATVQRVDQHFEGIFVVGLGTLLVKGEAGLIR